jgi:hypothetical protein
MVTCMVSEELLHPKYNDFWCPVGQCKSDGQVQCQYRTTKGCDFGRGYYWASTIAIYHRVSPSAPDEENSIFSSDLPITASNVL